MPAEYESSLARAVAFADQFCSRSTVLRLALRRAQCNANNFTVPACHHAFGARLSNVDSPSSFFVRASGKNSSASNCSEYLRASSRCDRASPNCDFSANLSVKSTELNRRTFLYLSVTVCVLQNLSTSRLRVIASLDLPLLYRCSPCRLAPDTLIDCLANVAGILPGFLKQAITSVVVFLALLALRSNAVTFRDPFVTWFEVFAPIVYELLHR